MTKQQKERPKVIPAAAVSRNTKRRVVPKRSPLAALRQRLKRVEMERDFYAKELARKLAEEFNPADVDEDELERLLENGSGVSLKSLIREIAKDAVR
jgi:CBS-domain-containing membrane protein